jgi:hypothetical protein
MIQLDSTVRNGGIEERRIRDQTGSVPKERLVEGISRIQLESIVSNDRIEEHRVM